MSDASTPVHVDVHLPADWADEAMSTDIRRAFTGHPKTLPPMWLYDDRGSDLFDAITRLPEYYPTEAERSILGRRAGEIAASTGADTVIELGSGTSDKTRTLLDAFAETGQLRDIVIMDVSEQTLRDAGAMLGERYEHADVHAVVGDFTRHLRHLPKGGTRLIAFLGGTIGNFHVEERRAFLGAIADSLEAGDSLLLGVDLVKRVSRIVDAYHDATGVTEAFIRNVVTVLNREMDADLDADAFDYIPFWDAKEERMDLRLRARMPMSARIERLDLDVEFGEGEELRVEVSTKFRPDRLSEELTDVGFEGLEWFTDHAEDFGLVLARKA